MLGPIFLFSKAYFLSFGLGGRLYLLNGQFIGILCRIFGDKIFSFDDLLIALEKLIDLIRAIELLLQDPACILVGLSGPDDFVLFFAV